MHRPGADPQFGRELSRCEQGRAGKGSLLPEGLDQFVDDGVEAVVDQGC